MRELNEKGKLPKETGKLCRSAGYVADELAMLPPEGYESLAPLVAEFAREEGELRALVEAAASATKGGGMCGGSKSATVAPGVDTMGQLMEKELKVAQLRSRLRKGTREAHTSAKRTSTLARSASSGDFWEQRVKGEGGEDASWEDAESVLVAELAASADNDMEEGDAESEKAAATAVKLLPRLKTALCDENGKVKVARLREIFGADASSLREVVVAAAAAAAEAERVFTIEVRELDADGVPQLMKGAEAGYVMARGNATCAELRKKVMDAASALVTAGAEQLEFLASGAFNWALHGGRTRLDPEQESSITAFDHVPGICVMRTKNASAVELSAIDLSGLLAEAAAEEEDTQKKERAAKLTLADVLADAKLLDAFEHATMARLPIEHTQFLAELASIRSEVGNVADGAVAFRIAERRCKSLASNYMKADSPLGASLQLEGAVRDATMLALKAALHSPSAGDAAAIVGAFADAERALMAVCEKHLDGVRADLVVTRSVLKPRTGSVVGQKRKPTVVVVGGGVAGATMARWLDKHHHGIIDLVLVDPKSYHEFTPHINRARVSTGDVQKRIRPPHAEYVRHGQVIVEGCTAVCADHIKVGTTGVVPFDFCVIATGTAYAENVKTTCPSLDYRLRQFDAERRALAAARRVLIIGGGVVAMETAGDVHDAFPKKEMVIVCRSTILRKSGPAAHKALTKHWESAGVKVVPNSAVLRPKEGDTHYKTVDGVELCPIEGTRAIWCTGRGAAQTGFMPKESLDEYGYIRVNEHCQVEGFGGNVFAVGDCVYAAAHIQADRTMIGCNLHGFVTRLNVVALSEQLAKGTPPELYSCPHKLPFKLDQSMQETGFGSEGFKGCMLGYDKYCVIYTPKALSEKGADITSKRQLVKIYDGVAGANGAGHVDWCDVLRNPDYKIKGMSDPADMFFSHKSDYKGQYNMFNFMTNHIGIGKRLMGAMMKGMKATEECHMPQAPDMEEFHPEDLFAEDMNLAPSSAK